MGYIIKDTAALLNTRLTDAARKKMSEGTFNITYFQIGDSEVCYDCVENQNISEGMVIESEFNSQNLSPLPQKNKMNIKYPLYVNSDSTSTFGIPINQPSIDSIYNVASPRGFFTTGSSGTYSAFTSTEYVINPNYIFDINNLSSGNTITITPDIIDSTVSGQTIPGHYAVMYYGNNSSIAPIENNYPVLFYKIIGVTGSTSGNTTDVDLLLDRDLPDFSSLGVTGNGRILIYPTGMTEIYDTITPDYYWYENIINFESNCDVSAADVKIWNMNIPWTESPAGIWSSTHLDYNNYESKKYVGTKEYLGYNSISGQTDTDSTYYYNSFGDKIKLTPDNQKSIAIVHYTNQAIDNFYGEKFAFEPFDILDNDNTYGAARNFRIHIPWLMWHKSSGGTMGETFYVDPEGFEDLNLFEVHYIQSLPNTNMNNPGIRYYHLWDKNPNDNGYPNRVGKVWPDLKMITFDDDEIIAAMSYKSNRNWTLPAPKLGLITPNTFVNEVSDEGLLSGETQGLWVTYRFNNTAFTQSLHCNYYTYIQGNSLDCPPYNTDVIFRFGNEFPFLISDLSNGFTGFTGNEFVILAQKVNDGEKPDPTKWVEINMGSQISASTINNYLTVSGLTGTTFVIDKDNYETSELNGYYHLEDYINIPSSGDTGATLNFGGEYFFYGTIETEIQATIYVMNYVCNLGSTQFLSSSNPTWDNTYTPYVSEVGLYDNNKELMIITKVQSPEMRLGVQQYSIKLDF
jgi:hypothetical protein